MHAHVLLAFALARLPAAALLFGPASLGPDLMVEVQQTDRGIPSAWVVRNAGKGGAGPSILKIFVKLRPFEAPTAAALALAGADPAALCRVPARAYVELISALKAGEARTVIAPGLFPPLAPLPEALRRSAPFVCVFDVSAAADANDDVKETNESNNTALRTVERRM